MTVVGVHNAEPVRAIVRERDGVLGMQEPSCAAARLDPFVGDRVAGALVLVVVVAGVRSVPATTSRPDGAFGKTAGVS